MQIFKKLIITNNPQINESFGGKHSIIYDEGMSYSDVLLCVRDNIHAGRKLLTHPLSGSVKPHETPYKTVLLSAETYALDMQGLLIIEESIAVTEKLAASVLNSRKISESVLKDYQLVDYYLVENILNNR